MLRSCIPDKFIFR